jgi:hypothetical protein
MDKKPTKVRYSKRWFCYLDLLGFRRLVERDEIHRILPTYEKALRHLEQSAVEYKHRGLYSSWFSDTFIIYSESDRSEHFALVEHVGRVFFQELILNRIPVRGALAHGDLYSQQERNIFIGPALIDAYSYGEGQDWLGFMLTPSAIEAMSSIGLPAPERPMYREVQETGILKPGLSGPVYAYAFNNGLVAGKNPFKLALESMKETADHKQQSKYERTLSFLSQGSWHGRQGG